MDSTEKLIGEILFGWLHVICTPLLFLGPLHPGAQGIRSTPCGGSKWTSPERRWTGSEYHA